MFHELSEAKASDVRICQNSERLWVLELKGDGPKAAICKNPLETGRALPNPNGKTTNRGKESLRLVIGATRTNGGFFEGLVALHMLVHNIERSTPTKAVLLEMLDQV